MEGKLKRNNGIDLIKAFSMISVVLYHFYEFKGTYIGVLLFFVISGYFITSSLMEKEESYFKFLYNRLMRIYPILLAVLVFSLLLFIYFNGFLTRNICSSSLASLFGVSNIYQIVKKMSYFERTGDLFPLLHTWTLSIEIQFYIFFPFVIYTFKKLKKSNKINFGILIFLSLISAFIMFYKSFNNYEINEIYYGTDTRTFSLFIGSAIYFYSLGDKVEKEFNKRIVNNLAIFSLVVIIISILTVDYFMKINYYGLLYILSILGGVVILAIMKTEFLSFENKFIRFFSNLGKKSYSYYMWQYPIMIFTMEYYKWSDIDYGKTVLIQIVILILVAEASYFIFEKDKKRAKVSNVLLGVIYFGLLFLGPFSEEVKANPNKILVEEQLDEEIKIKNKVDVKKEIEDKSKDIEENIDEIFSNDFFGMEGRLLEEIETNTSGETETNKIIVNKEKLNNRFEKNQVEKVSDKYLNPNMENKTKKEINKEVKKIVVKIPKCTFIGDSVMKGSESNIKKKFKGSYVDAKVSRQFTELPKILKKLRQGNHINEVVVVHLGTNGLITKSSFETSMKILRNKKVFFINCVVPKRWEKPVNKSIKEWAKGYQNIKIIDWYGRAKGKRKLFSKDATHPSIVGRKVYTQLIFDNIQ